MLFRFLPLIPMLLAMAQTAPGDEIPVKAGDAAPAIDWSKIVQSPPDFKFNPSLAGQYSVLQFLGPVTANGQAIERWNQLIAAFRGQPVQFIWIASEPWSKVEPFLKDHALDGWLLVDETRQIARSWGFEDGAGDAIVEPSGRIAGFKQFLEAEELSAAIAGKPARLDREPYRFPRPEPMPKPDIPASREVHISSSKTEGTEGSSGPDFWVQRGFGLKQMLAIVYETDEARVDLPKALDDGRKFDFVAVLPQPEDQKEIYQLAQEAIGRYFRVSVVRETKPADVYIMTALKDKMASRKSAAESMGGSSSWTSSVIELPPGTAPTPEAIRKMMEEQSGSSPISSLSASGSDMKDLSKTLQEALGKPVIDETGLSGSYDIAVKGEARSTEEFIDALREQTGIVLTPATRAIELITVRAFN